MERVLVIGCGGSGKTRLARTLAERLELPLVHLDREYWHPGWIEPAREDWEARVRELCAGERWIMDGNYGGTLRLRLGRADTVIFLDLATATCLRGILHRYLRWRGKVRPDLPQGCTESIDLQFVRYVLRYRRTRRPRLLDQLSSFDGTIVTLRSRRYLATDCYKVRARSRDWTRAK